MPLSANEKAATFIGWKPGQRCTLGKMSCTHDSNTWVNTPHVASAPDMSDPRNYMRALEAVAVRWLWDLCNCPEFMPKEPWELTLNKIGVKRDRDDYGNDIAVYSTSVGGVVIKALAALYDAEHPEPDHGSV